MARKVAIFPFNTTGSNHPWYMIGWQSGNETGHFAGPRRYYKTRAGAERAARRKAERSSYLEFP